MTRFALNKGLNVPPSVTRALAGHEACRRQVAEASERDSSVEPECLAALTRAHNRMATIVAPALPGAILMMERERNEPGRFRRMLGGVRETRYLLGFMVLAFVTFVFVRVLGAALVDAAKISSEALASVSLLAAAGTGAAFAELARANRYIVRATYRQEHAISYFYKPFVGMVAGFTLVVLISDAPGSERTQMLAMSEPVIAFLGGFSVNVVYRVLTRAASAFEAALGMDWEDTIEDTAVAHTPTDPTTGPLELKAGLLELKRRVMADTGDDADTIAALDEMLGDIDAELA